MFDQNLNTFADLPVKGISSYTQKKIENALIASVPSWVQLLPSPSSSSHSSSWTKVKLQLFQTTTINQISLLILITGHALMVSTLSILIYTFRMSMIPQL